MEWWAALIAVGAMACGALAVRSSALSFLSLTAFMPLALHTLYNDFSRFWVLMALFFAVEIVALIRFAGQRDEDENPGQEPPMKRPLFQSV